MILAEQRAAEHHAGHQPPARRVGTLRLEERMHERERGGEEEAVERPVGEHPASRRDGEERRHEIEQGADGPRARAEQPRAEAIEEPRAQRADQDERRAHEECALAPGGSREHAGDPERERRMIEVAQREPARDAHGVRFVDAEAERSRQKQPERGRAGDERGDRAGRVYGIVPVHPGPRSATPGFAPVTFVSRTTATPFTHTSMTPVLT